MSEMQTNQVKRYRGVVLQFVYTNHREQLARMDDVALWGLMLDMGYGVGQNNVLTLLQDLSDRGYLSFNEKLNRVTGRTEISKIQITPGGRDLVERTREDAAVLIP